MCFYMCFMLFSSNQYISHIQTMWKTMFGAIFFSFMSLPIHFFNSIMRMCKSILLEIIINIYRRMCFVSPTLADISLFQQIFRFLFSRDIWTRENLEVLFWLALFFLLHRDFFRDLRVCVSVFFKFFFEFFLPISTTSSFWKIAWWRSTTCYFWKVFSFNYFLCMKQKCMKKIKEWGEK